jgi:hypothetical protein
MVAAFDDGRSYNATDIELDGQDATREGKDWRERIRCDLIVEGARNMLATQHRPISSA